MHLLHTTSFVVQSEHHKLVPGREAPRDATAGHVKVTAHPLQGAPDADSEPLDSPTAGQLPGCGFGVGPPGADCEAYSIACTREMLL